MFLHYGYVTPTQEIQEDWGNWFTTYGDKMIDSGNPFGYGKEITATESKELPLDLSAITGYSIISAADFAEAEEIAKACPSITSIRVYEMNSM